MSHANEKPKQGTCFEHILLGVRIGRYQDKSNDVSSFPPAPLSSPRPLTSWGTPHGKEGVSTTCLSLGILCVWVKSLWEHLSDVDIDPGVAHVVFVRLPIHDLVTVVGMLRKVFRECVFQYPRDPMVGTSASWARHDQDVAGSEEDWDRLSVPSETTDKEYGCVP